MKDLTYIRQEIYIIKERFSTWQIIVTLPFAALLYLTLQPMDEGLGKMDMKVLNGMAAFSLFAIIVSFFKKERLRLGLIDYAVLGLFLYYTINTYAVSDTPCATVFLKNCLWMVLYISSRLLLTELRFVGNTLIPILCIIGGIIEVGHGLSQIFGLEQSRHFLWIITGSFYNPGPYGCYLAVMLSVTSAAYKKTHNKWYGCAIIPMLVILPATWSRASILAYAVVICMLYWKVWIRYWKTLVFVALLGIIALYLIKRGSADGRLFMFYMSLLSLADNLFVGVGTGGYLSDLGEMTANYFSVNPSSRFADIVGVPDHTFCEPMRIAVEQGLIGLILYAMVIGLSIRVLLIEKSPLAYGLMSLIIFSCFSYPFSITPFCILVTLFVTMAASVQSEKSLGFRRIWRIMPIFAIICILSFVCSVLIPRIKTSEEYRRFSGIKDKAFIKDYYEVQPLMNDDASFLFNFGALLRDYGRYNDSSDILRQGAKLSADPMFETLVGRNYEQMKRYEEADSLFSRASRMQPNRIYPVYRQMKLYETMNDNERLKKKAEEVINFIPKVDSPATEEMKKEARMIILNK